MIYKPITNDEAIKLRKLVYDTLKENEVKTFTIGVLPYFLKEIKPELDLTVHKGSYEKALIDDLIDRGIVCIESNSTSIHSVRYRFTDAVEFFQSKKENK